MRPARNIDGDVSVRAFHEAADARLELGMDSIRLLSSNPLGFARLAERGIRTERKPTPQYANPHNQRYLVAKKQRLGHQLDDSHDG